MASPFNSGNEKRGNMIVGCAVALFVIFLALKATGHIDWSWWTVSTPLLVLAFLGVVGQIQMAYHSRSHARMVKAIEAAGNANEDTPLGRMLEALKQMDKPRA